MPSWSPDGTRIAFVSDRTDPHGDVFVMNADGTGITQLTSGPEYDSSPQWSPDGSRIAFTSSRGGAQSVFVMHADGSDLHPLVASQGEIRFAWSPDGKEIAFARGGGSGCLYVMRSDGSDLGEIASNAHYGFGDIAWRPVPAA